MSKISAYAAISVASITGTSQLIINDTTGSPTVTKRTTAGDLRTAMFAAGTGFTATDPLVVGTITAGDTVQATKDRAVGFGLNLLSPSATTGVAAQIATSTSNGAIRLGVQNSSATQDYSGPSAAYAGYIGTVSNTNFDFFTNDIYRGGFSASGVLAIGTTVIAGCAAGEVTLPNNSAYRAVNAAGSATQAMLFLDSSNRTTIAANSLALRVDSPLTVTTVGAAGGASALPALPTGYVRMNISGVDRNIPYYAT